MKNNCDTNPLMCRMFITLKHIIVFSCIIFTGISICAQTDSKKKVKLVHSDEWMYDETVSDAQRLIGHVQLEYNGTDFYCDSAYLYSNDDFDAFGKIRIVRKPDYSVTSDKLHFDKKENTARLQQNIVMRDKDMTLTTNQLNYNLDTQIASYTGGGKIISNANNNVLTSDKGFYHATTENFFFRKNVVLTNPSYIVNSDTMQYNSISEVTYFIGPTTIQGENSSIYCENGYYNTKKDQSRFGKNAKVISGESTLTGDSIFYNGKTGIGEVFRNVQIADSSGSYIISGEYGKHNELTGMSIVTQRAMLTQLMGEDSLFLHADTLKSIHNESGGDILLAYYGVKFYKDDLQGKCDSLIYTSADSSLYMYHLPVLWSDQNQVTGDSISLHIAGGKIETLHVRNNSMIISAAIEKEEMQDTLKDKFNQIKGRNIKGLFIDNALHEMDVQGSGQLVYFPTAEAESPTVIGHNLGESSNIHITVEENRLSRIRLEKDTNSIYSPLDKANEKEFRLDGFNWRIIERPMSREEIFH